MQSRLPMCEVFIKQEMAGVLAVWAGNVSTSVAIVFINKLLMNADGYGFKYGAHFCQQ